MYEESFTQAVEEDRSLHKRVYTGKDRSMVPSCPKTSFEARPASFLPSAPTVYAVVSDPAVVDNPDIPSYQAPMPNRP